MADVHVLTPVEMLHSYERGWHHRGSLGDLGRDELAFVQTLTATHGSWLENEITANRMFQQQLHQQILKILGSLRAEFLRDCQIFFGGGTLLALKYGEYRLSKDIDFLCSSQKGYRQLRQTIFKDGYAALFQDQSGLSFPREIQANRYGVRFPVVIDGQTIRLEIVSEGRIELGEAEQLDWCPVVSLNDVDIVAEKLLANSDRWNDTSVLSRDLIDLAMLRCQGELPAAAFEKAEAAYPVVEPLQQAIAWFLERPEYQAKCYEVLQIQDVAAIQQGLDRLKLDVILQ